MNKNKDLFSVMEGVNSINNKLKQLRKSAGLKQSELAEMCGVSQQIISYIEQEERLPTIQLAKQIAKVFGLNVEQLWSMFYEDD